MDKPADLRRLIERASQESGGDEALAQRLGVTVEVLKAWAEGRTKPPSRALALLLAVVIDPTRPDPP